MRPDHSPLDPERAVTPDLPVAIRHIAPVVTVIGDLILDGWWTGRSERMSREAPAPVVDVDERRFAAGGAANTAVNLAALGVRVRVAGLIGADEAGSRLRELLVAAGIDVAALVQDPRVRTTTKTRIIAGDQVLVRIDEAHQGPYPAEAIARLAAAVVASGADAAAEVICDYGAGVLAGPVTAALAARDARPHVTVVDAHDPRPWAVIHPHLITPNAGETARLLGRGLGTGAARADTVVRCQDELLAAAGAEAAVVTLDRDGTVSLHPGRAPHRTFAHPTTEKQASGAGDTFVAALTAARACGLSLEGAADLAQHAADVVVRRFGTSVCSTADLVRQLGQIADAALDQEELVRRVQQARAGGKRIVLTNGCFDVLHRGHTSYLEQAARLGDVLIVALNDDVSVRRLKGPGRPINSVGDRVSVLAALSCVDHVTVFDSDTPIPLIDRIRPDVYAKGGDYTPDMLEEAEAVRANGGEVRILDYVPEHSTTAVVERILGAPQGQGAA